MALNCTSQFSASCFCFVLLLLLFVVVVVLICVDSKSVLYALQNWDYKMRRDIIYEVKYLIHCIMFKGIGTEFCWAPSHCDLYWNEISDKLAKQGALQNMSETITSRFHFLRLLQSLRKLCIKNLKKSKSVIPSCSRYSAIVIYKFSLNSWNAK